MARCVAQGRGTRRSRERATRGLTRRLVLYPPDPRDIRLDTRLNKYIWSKGIRNVPYRVRVKLSRRRNEDEEATEKVRAFCRSSCSVMGVDSRVRVRGERWAGGRCGVADLLLA